MSVPNGSHEHAGEPNGLGVLVTGDHRRRARQYGAIDASDFDSVECTLRVHWGRRANRRMALLTAALAQRRLGYLDGRTRGRLFTLTGGTRLSVRRMRSLVHGAAHRAGIDPKTMSAAHRSVHVGDAGVERRDADRDHSSFDGLRGTADVPRVLAGHRRHRTG
jgi:hypothetical protein